MLDSIIYRRVLSLVSGVFAALLWVAPLAHAQPTIRPARPGQGPTVREPGMMVRFIREHLEKLDLSADQKKQIDGFLSDAESQLNKIMKESGNAKQQDLREKVRPIMSDLREKIGGVLTDEQKQKLQQEMAKLRAGNGGQANPLNRLRDNLDKLGLSDDQKTKALAVVDEAQKKQSDMREQIDNGNGDPKQIEEKRQQLREEVQKKLADILTQDQQDELRQLMEAGDGERGSGGPGARGGQTPSGGPGAGAGGARPAGKGGDN